MKLRKQVIGILLTGSLLAGIPAAAPMQIWASEEAEIPALPGLTYEHKMDLTFAEGFDVYYYTDGYKLLDIHGDRQYLTIPEGKEAPEGVDDDIVLLHQPLDKIYLAATATMSLFDAIDAIDSIRLSAVQASGWYIEHAAQAMEAGEILFAGKYSEPDYELLINEECDLAIESTMILHSPKVQEMIEAMDVPVLIDRSSYENHPLGRTEWVKAYGALTDREEIAAAFFDEQAKVIDKLKDFQNTEKTVAFFYISSDGSVVVRSPEDYVPKMIEIAGGRYIFDTLDGEALKKSSVNLTMEEFYATAIDADYLVYNATIDDPIYNIDDLYQKDVLFADFKAVQEGNVWCAGKYLYQATDIVGNLITDLNLMLTDGDAAEMTFLTKIE
ncbi:MAG: ABC transporter substrate-binding protein [Clostridiales bacterium]|nr:ABC transporter substrate-binding protein [Candidatus Blautia equi]